MINNSLTAARPASPFLVTRANRELPLIADVRGQHAHRFAMIPLQAQEPVGIDLLGRMAAH